MVLRYIGSHWIHAMVLRYISEAAARFTLDTYNGVEVHIGGLTHHWQANALALAWTQLALGTGTCWWGSSSLRHQYMLVGLINS
jgi:hypothetical protein